MAVKKENIKERYLPRIKETWQKSQENFPDFLQEVSESSKRKNEEYIKQQQEKFSAVWQSGSITKEYMDKMLSEAVKNAGIFGLDTLIGEETLADAQKAMKNFLQKVRRFAPDMDIEDMGKAARNYMAYAVFNMMNDQKQECSEAIFAYSMLYPVTDNLLDDPRISLKAKEHYNVFIKDMLMGLSPKATSKSEGATGELLQRIIDDYPMDANEDIYTILLCMLEAQEGSMRQHSKTRMLTQAELLDITVYKGGVSVLADRYFVKKEMSYKDMYFYLAFGFVLQLADDLQDIKQDKTDGSQTLMMALSRDKLALEKSVNRQFHFAKNTMGTCDAGKAKLREILAGASYQLILFSAYESRAFLSEEYMAMLEKYLPVSYSFIEEYKNLAKERPKLSKAQQMKIIDDLL